MAYLKSSTSNTPWRVFKLEEARTVLGRHPSCHVILDNDAVSRHHAQVLESHGHFFLEDLKSRNGTMLNGRPVLQPTALHENDTITLCDHVFHFHLRPPGDPEPDIESDTHGLEHGSDNSRFYAVGVEPIDDLSSSSSILSKLPVVTPLKDRVAADPEAKLQAVIEISKSLGQVLEFDAVLPRILDGLFEIFPQVLEGFVLLRDETSGKPVIRATRNRGPSGARPPAVSLTVVREAMESGEAILSADVLGDHRFQASQSIAGMRLRSMMCAPLVSQEGEAMGVIQLASREVAVPFVESDLDILVGVANQGALAIEHAKLHASVLKQRDLERELEFATQVQLGFLPKKRPQVGQVEFCDFYEAAHRVGGDYFDYVELPDGRVAVAVADVAGKGIAAALLMARLYSAARFYLLSEPKLSDALSGLNHEITTSGLGHRFITCVVVVIDPSGQQVTIANAGHPPPLLKHADGSVSEMTIANPGLPMGIMPDQEFDEQTWPLESGETCLLFTDGITEAMNEGFEIFGSPRLEASLAAAPHELDQLVHTIVSDVERHCDGHPQSDDMCLVAFRRTG